MFKDRKDAGIQLGRALKAYYGKDIIILAIPKGGVEVGFYVARTLNRPLQTVVVRKLPLPDQPEAGFGAIAEDGSTFIFDKTPLFLPKAVIKRVKLQQVREIKHRVRIFRGNTPLPDLQNKTVILVDDGLAMGSTMRAAIMLCRNKKAKKVVVAAPVASADTSAEMEQLADEVVVLDKPVFFRAVADAYENWYDVSDEEAMEFLQESHDHVT